MLSSHLGDEPPGNTWLVSLYYISNHVARGFVLPYLHAPEHHLNSTVIILTALRSYQVQVTGTSFWKGFVLFTHLGNRSSHPVSCTGLVFPAHFWHYSAVTVKIRLTCQLPLSNNCIISSISKPIKQRLFMGPYALQLRCLQSSTHERDCRAWHRYRLVLRLASFSASFITCGI